MYTHSSARSLVAVDNRAYVGIEFVTRSDS